MAISSEIITIISTASAGIGIGVGWFVKQYSSSRNGNGVLKKTEHDEVCKLKFETIHEKFLYGEQQFVELKKAIEDTRERLLARMDKIILK